MSDVTKQFAITISFVYGFYWCNYCIWKWCYLYYFSFLFHFFLINSLIHYFCPCSTLSSSEQALIWKFPNVYNMLAIEQVLSYFSEPNCLSNFHCRFWFRFWLVIAEITLSYLELIHSSLSRRYYCCCCCIKITQANSSPIIWSY